MDLGTRYLGLDLRHPIVASASPLTSILDGILRFADAGAAAIVMARSRHRRVVRRCTFLFQRSYRLITLARRPLVPGLPAVAFQPRKNRKRAGPR
jgi:hypothetical protein